MDKEYKFLYAWTGDDTGEYRGMITVYDDPQMGPSQVVYCPHTHTTLNEAVGCAKSKCLELNEVDGNPLPGSLYRD